MKNQGKITGTKGQVNNTAVTAKDAIRSAIPSNESALTPSKAFEEVNADGLAFNGQPSDVIETEAPIIESEKEIETPIVEPTKMEIKMGIAERIAEQKTILDRHIKLGDELARKIKHRENLKTIISTLEEFELSLKDDVDETGGNYYQGCLLTIKDDNGKTFTTKNPAIIKGVAEQVNSLCTEKLEEVETGIVNLIPAS
ncbi:MAG: hypothetical protein P0Y49_13710 [Candidatus Pedobacter colombiensis]|uniref:Uncharacterized protein n=1 Tax=Candidatus Pedobacter colombiensis TaxID=3121371 RepID=A0AAJ5W5B5_9SPHI|nr:hypothetical protein [Pedobacter sp.]WEK17855.1 MAG: hypothetical protein P0Y49_13710 [Pedobacter sp.]